MADSRTLQSVIKTNQQRPFFLTEILYSKSLQARSSENINQVTKIAW